MNRQIAATAILLCLSAILYLAVTQTLKKAVFLPLLPPPSGERVYAVTLENTVTKRAADGTSQQVAQSSWQGTFEEKWARMQDEKLEATFFFVPQEVHLYRKSVTGPDSYQQPVFATMTQLGGLAAMTFPSDMPPVTRGALTSLVFYRTFTRGESTRWQGTEQGETGPVTAHYVLEGNTLIRTLGAANTREGYQSSTIVYHLTEQKQVDTIDIDLTYVKIFGEFKLVSQSRGSFHRDAGRRAAMLSASNAAKHALGSYETVAMGPGAARPLVLDNPSMPRIDIRKAWYTLEEVLIRGDTREKTSYFMALSRYFAVHPEDLDHAKEYLLAMDPSSTEYQEKAAIVIGAMDHLQSPQAEETLIALLNAPATPMRDDIVLQSAMSLGGHLAPSTSSVQPLWQTYTDESLATESRSAALMALGAIASRLNAEGAQKVRRLLLPLAESPNPTAVAMGLTAMAGHGDTSYFKVVSDHLRNHPQMTVRLEAARALARIRSLASAELVHEVALADPSWQVRLECAQSLAQQIPGKKEVKLALSLYDQSTDLAVRERALFAVSLLAQDDGELARTTFAGIYQRENVPELKSLAATYLHQRTD